WALRPRLGGSASHDGTAHVAFGSKDNLRPSDKGISGLNHTPHAAAVYASRPPLLAVSRNTRFQAARYALPGLDFHQLIAPASWRSLAHPTMLSLFAQLLREKSQRPDGRRKVGPLAVDHITGEICVLRGHFRAGANSLDCL